MRPFAEALSSARRLERLMLVRSVATLMGLVGGAAALGWFWLGHPIHAANGALLAVYLGHKLAPLPSLGSRLSGYRGAAPDHWLSSGSHGVLAILGDTLAAGGLAPATLDRHAETHVESIAYDEVAHLVTVDVRRLLRKRNGEEVEERRRERVVLTPDVTPAEALAFVRRALELSAR